MAKVIKTLRNNWKKTVFGCIVSYYGINYMVNKRKQFHLMRALCEEAGKFGNMPLPIEARNKHITVFVNPSAAGRNGKKKYEKYGEPLLHMAGFLVTTVKTERVDEAKELTALIKKTNIIAVAGGDGTLCEVVTGLLRRDDADEAVKMYPIGIIPVGSENEFATSLFGKNEDEAATISSAAMAILKHRIEPKDVIELKVMETAEGEGNGMLEKPDGDGTLDKPEGDVKLEKPEGDVTLEKPKLKPTYAMSGMRLGMFREALKKKEDMPSFMGDYFNTFWAFLRTDSGNFKAEIRYTPACPGCLKCYVEDSSKSQSSSWLSRIGSIFRARKAEENPKPTTVNEECGKWTSVCVETPEFNIKPRGDGSLTMEIGRKLGFFEFLAQGFKLISDSKDTIDHTIAFDEAEIVPLQAPEFCSIDGEEFEVKPIHIRVLKKKLLFFTPS